MKIKGCWTSYLALCKESCKWLKDYWAIYLVVTLLLATLFSLPQLIDLYKFNKKIKKINVEEDFG